MDAMDISGRKFIWGACQILALWVPVILSGCNQDLNVLGFGAMQKFVALDREIHASCRTLLDNLTKECSQDCDDQVMKMVALYEGNPIFFTCDCTRPASIYPTDVCLNVQERLAICPSLRVLLATQSTTSVASTTPTILDDGRVPCDGPYSRCQHNSNCQHQLRTTIDACVGLGCNEDCQKSLDILLIHREAQGLWGCIHCRQNGEEGSWCDLARRCQAAQTQETAVPSLLPYKPGDTAKSAEEESDGGSARKSVKPSTENSATTVAACFTSILYLIMSVSFCIVIF